MHAASCHWPRPAAGWVGMPGHRVASQGLARVGSKHIDREEPSPAPGSVHQRSLEEGTACCLPDSGPRGHRAGLPELCRSRHPLSPSPAKGLQDPRKICGCLGQGGKRAMVSPQGGTRGRAQQAGRAAHGTCPGQGSLGTRAETSLGTGQSQRWQHRKAWHCWGQSRGRYRRAPRPVQARGGLGKHWALGESEACLCDCIHVCVSI